MNPWNLNPECSPLPHRSRRATAPPTSWLAGVLAVLLSILGVPAVGSLTPLANAGANAIIDDDPESAATDSSPAYDDSSPYDASDDSAETAGIADANIARIRALDGTATLERYKEESSEDVSLNSPIYAGDTLSTESGGRAEIQLSNGSLLRLDRDTRVTFLSLPGTDTRSDRAALLQVARGSAEVEIRGEAPQRGEFQIDVPSASIYLLASGKYRIDLAARGGVRVSSYRGAAEVTGQDGTVTLRSGQRTIVESDGEPGEPRAFNTVSADDFDAWIGDRGERYVASAREDDRYDDEQIPDTVRPYRSELNAYGRWVQTPEYGTVWVPSGQAQDWTPYSNGYWDEGPYGSFWVSYDPWGWAPYHYGRWSWYASYGWFWCPGSIFAPAWVSWYYGPSYVGWCPLGFWDNPCWIGRGWGGFDFRCWHFTGWHDMWHRHVRRAFVDPVHVRREIEGGHGVVTRRPVSLGMDAKRRRLDPQQVISRARQTNGGGLIDMKRVSQQGHATGRPFRDRERVAARSLQPGASRAAAAGQGQNRFHDAGGSRQARPGISPRGGVSGSGRDERAFPSRGIDRHETQGSGASGRGSAGRGRSDSERSFPPDSRVPRDRRAPDGGPGDRRSGPQSSWDDRFDRGHRQAPRERPPRDFGREARPSDPRTDRNLREFFRGIDRRPEPPRDERRYSGGDAGRRSPQMAPPPRGPVSSAPDNRKENHGGGGSGARSGGGGGGSRSGGGGHSGGGTRGGGGGRGGGGHGGGGGHHR